MNKHTFFREFNEALMSGNITYILESVTTDVSWEMIGNDTIYGKDVLAEVLAGMDQTMEYKLTIEHIIIDSAKAVVNGIIEVTTKLNELKTYGFCDIYQLAENEDDKISKITSYVIQK
ncbi:SnoaL-like domain protein [Paraliobacillus sp. PM-2]|uniref:nuclear transport factor 2 family protein n=1 Tax=Paraliobacillus sp. PM-2 TaxID=1462524 RepID=UPI00061C4FD7|nr:nuclear transport factor 2 family protein [Paraliobacillus sp. PM-2]CQR47955.1 SnoaL-like domain protein [Paraliobacillus sp. PM-2]